MNGKNTAEFFALSFDEQLILLKTNPKAFDKMAKGMIQEFIESTPPEYQEKLKDIQYEVDDALKGLEGKERLDRFAVIFYKYVDDFKDALNGNFKDPSVVYVRRNRT